MGPQTSAPATGLLAQFTGLENDNWVLTLRGDCANGSLLQVTRAILDGWVGVDGGTVSNNTLDDRSDVRGQNSTAATPDYSFD